MSFDFSVYKRIEIPEGRVKQIARASDGLVLWKSGYINQIPLSINADGSIYNGGKGYKDGFRVRSGGEETGANNSRCTGYIKVNGGDVIRIAGCDVERITNTNAINVSDASFNNIGQVTPNFSVAGYGIFGLGGAYEAYCWYSGKIENGVYEWIVPPIESNIAYIRVTGCVQNKKDMVVTVNEEIT